MLGLNKDKISLKCLKHLKRVWSISTKLIRYIIYNAMKIIVPFKTP